MTTRAHRMRVPGAVPALVLRAVLVGVVGVAAAVLLGSTPLWAGIAVLLALVFAAVPRSLAAWPAAGLLALGVVLSSPDPSRTAMAVFAVHLVHVLAGVLLVAPAFSWIRLDALLPALRRFAVVQVVAQICALAIALLPVTGPSVPGTGLGGLAPLGGVLVLAAAVGAVLLVRRVDRPRAPRDADVPRVPRVPRDADVGDPS